MSSAMSKPTLDADTILKRAAPVTGQHAHEIQPFGHLVRMPIALSEHACKESVDNLNQLVVDAVAERIQLLGGVSVAMAHDVAETTLVPRVPKGREEVPVQVSRLLHAHEI